MVERIKTCIGTDQRLADSRMAIPATVFMHKPRAELPLAPHRATFEVQQAWAWLCCARLVLAGEALCRMFVAENCNCEGALTPEATLGGKGHFSSTGGQNTPHSKTQRQRQKRSHVAEDSPRSKVKR